MRQLILIYLIVPVSLCFGQIAALPVVENNRWAIVNGSGGLIAATPYSYIHTFDESGLSYYHHKGAFGIVSAAGKEITPPVFTDARQVGNGRYFLRGDAGWLYYQTDKNGNFGLSDTLESFESLSEGWSKISFGKDIYVYNERSGQRIKIRNDACFMAYHDHLLVRTDSLEDVLLDPQGKVILSANNLRSNGYGDLYCFRGNGRYYLFDGKGAWNTDGATSVVVSQIGPFIRKGAAGTLYDLNRNVILSGDFDEVSVLDDKYFIARRIGLCTLIDRNTGKQVKPNVYSDVTTADKGHYYVYRSGMMGYADENMNEIVPCRYTRFVRKGDLLHAYEINFQGIFSLKLRKEIIPAVYESIVQNGMRFKAYRSDMLDIYDIDDSHWVINKASLNNTVRIRQTIKNNYTPGRKFIDPRLFSIGWFLDSMIVTRDSNSFYLLKWGLRNAADSVTIKPVPMDLIYLPNSPYTIQDRKKQTFKISASQGIDAHLYHAIFYENGKSYRNYNMLSYETEDWLFRDYMRFNTFSDYGIFRRDGTASSYLYIGTGTYPSYCEGKEVISLFEEEPDSKEPFTFISLDHKYFTAQTARDPNGKEVVALKYPDGKWNFLDKSGYPLLKDTFSFVNEFVGDRAIVRKAKSWGVVSADSLIIPAKYAEIQRKFFERDTFFVAKMSQGGVRYLDTNAKVLDVRGISKVEGTNAIAEVKNEKWVMDEHLGKLIEGHSNYRFLDNGMILARNKKEISIFSSNGEELFRPAAIPEFFIGERYAVVREGSAFTVINTTGEAVLSGRKSVEQHGERIIARKDGETTIYDPDLKPLIQKVEGKILVDSVTGQVAVYNDGKTVIYSASGEKSERLKDFQPDHFYSAHLIISKGDSAGVYATNRRCLVRLNELTDMDVFRNGSIYMKMKDGSSLLFDRNWKPLLGNVKMRSVKYLGGDCYSYTARSGKTILVNALTNAMDSTATAIIGEFSAQRLLVRKANGFIYLDENLQPTTRSYYAKAIPFTGNFAAVGDQRGWTIIDRNGHSGSFPNFGPITALHRSLFETGRLPLYGLYDNKGRLLIPVAYEQLNFLRDGIIQAVREGEVSYFRKDGTKIF